MTPLKTTLCILRKDDQILLGYKKRGFGADHYNGIGGKVEPNETIEAAMIRETSEETGVTPLKYQHLATLTFHEFFRGAPETVQTDVFIATEWQGEPQETPEMAPKWFPISEIPYDQMLPDDFYWLPLILSGQTVKAQFDYDETFNILYAEINGVKISK